MSHTDLPKLTAFEDAVYSALLITHRQGRPDATARELCELINSRGLYVVAGRTVSDVQNGTVNGRLSDELSKKGLVVRVPGQRKDSRTRRWGDLWALSGKQVALMGQGPPDIEALHTVTAGGAA